MSVLLTDEAVNAAWEFVCPDPEHGDGDQTIRAFLRYHATEGREALRERAAEALWSCYGSVPWADAEEITRHNLRDDAEAVVTALFGEAP